MCIVSAIPFAHSNHPPSFSVQALWDEHDKYALSLRRDESVPRSGLEASVYAAMLPSPPIARISKAVAPDKGLPGVSESVIE